MNELGILGWTVAAAWAWLLLARGRFWLIEEEPAPPVPPRWPDIVAIIPARDEAESVGACIGSLLAQDYPGRLDLVLVDDQSGDGTGGLARAAAASLRAESRLRVIAGAPRPAGWASKVWAMAQGVAEAESSFPRAELLLFADADIVHEPAAVRDSAAHLLAGDFALVSRMVLLATDTLAERAISPAFVHFFRLLYPFRWVAEPRMRTAAAAGGHMLQRRESLAAAGGMGAIRCALIDDCALAAAIKRSGGRLSLALTRKARSIRRHDWAGLWRMIARSAYTELGHSPLRLAGACAGLLAGLVAPPFLAVACGWTSPGWSCAWAMLTLSYLPILRFYRVSGWWAPLLPLVALFFLGATLDSALRHWRGSGGAWKGRVAPRAGGGA